MRGTYDDDLGYDEGDGDQQQKMFLADEHLTFVDWLVAASLAVLVFIGVTVFALPGLSPVAWDSTAVAAGLRPPVDVFPGFWRAIAHALFLGGVSSGVSLLKHLGPVCAGCTAGAVYLLFRTVIGMLVRGRLRFSTRRYLVQRVGSAVGAVLFACSDPAWQTAQCFSSEGLLLLLTVLALVPFMLFMLNGTLLCAYVSMFLLGVLAAETPLGVILLLVCWLLYHVALRHDALGERIPLLEPITAQSAKWMLSFLWGVGLAVGLVLNCWSFLKMGGGATLTNSLPLAYGLRWWAVFSETAGSLGWVLAFVLCVLPFGVASIMLPRAVDEEQFLPYHIGGAFFVSGVVSFSQLSFVSPIWFWTWSPLTEVRSFYILQVCLLLSALVVGYFLVVLGTDACCRNHVKLASFRAQEEDQLPGVDVNVPTSIRGLVILSGVCLVMFVGSLPGRTQTKARAMLGVVNDYVAEVLKECGDARYLFTDGAFDTRLELGAAEKGKELVTLSLLAGNSSSEKNLRLRAAEDNEDRQVLESGAGTALRTWKRDRPERLKKSALMLGFSQWLRDGEKVPPVSGTLMRPGMSEAACKEGAAVAGVLAERVLELYEKGQIDSAIPPVSKKVFTLMQWRLACLARERAKQADHAGDKARAKAESGLADRLDEKNADLKGLVKKAEKRRAVSLRQVTPREGLQLALLRADFALASRYATILVETDPDNPDANFALGMYAFAQAQWTRAEEALMRCLVRKPNEPAVLNNLALAQMQQGNFEAATANAQKAQKLLPASDEVMETLAEIAAAKAAAAEAKKNPDKKAKSDGSKDRSTP